MGTTSIKALHRLFRMKVKKYGTVEAVAEAMMCSPEYVYTLMSDDNERRPALDMAARIEVHLGIPATAWADLGRKRPSSGGRKPKAA